MAFPNIIKQRAIELSNEDRSAGNVIEVLIREFKDDALPDERTIRRWRNEEQPRIPPSVPENWREHNARLVGVANTLLANDLKRVMEWVDDKGNIKYHLFDENEEHLVEQLEKDELTVRLDENINLVYQDHGDWFYKTCFLPHFYAEWPTELNGRGFGLAREKQPYQLIEVLRILSERKTFKGTCPVCKDW